MSTSAKIDILQSGYSRWIEKPSSMQANGTSTLVTTETGKKILVDTLGPWDRQHLIDLLFERNLSPENIDLLVCTHLHSDHIGNLNLFVNCPQIIGDQLSRKLDLFEFDIFRSNSSLSPNQSITKGVECIELYPDVELWSTPGHTSNCCSLVIRNVENLGTVAIVGDLFESENDLINDNIWIEAGSFNQTIQRKNREHMLNIADYIVPGHGEMFKVKR